MPSDAPYSISDLARLTGLSVRTIRYYLAQGLIPASGKSGPGAHYGEAHLGRLRLVRRLQQQHLPLAEIRTRLAALSDEEVTALGTSDATIAGAAPPTSALDYVRSVLAGPAPLVAAPLVPAPLPPVGPSPSPAQSPAMAPQAAGSSVARMPAMRDEAPAGRHLLRRMARPFVSELRAAAANPAMPLATAKPPPALQTAKSTEPQPIERSQWERLSLGPNLELHVRRPLGRLEQKRVERLITIARQVLKEEQP